jgi:hypothetical protein
MLLLDFFAMEFVICPGAWGFGMSLFGFGFGPIWLALCLGLKRPQQHFAAA